MIRESVGISMDSTNVISAIEKQGQARPNKQIRGLDLLKLII